jgi:hypothetical protein
MPAWMGVHECQRFFNRNMEVGGGWKGIISFRSQVKIGEGYNGEEQLLNQCCYYQFLVQRKKMQ